MNNAIVEASKVLFQARLDNFGAIFVVGDKEIKGVYSEAKHLLSFSEELDLKKDDIVKRKADGKTLKIVKHTNTIKSEVFIHRDFEVQEVDETPQETPNQQ